MIGSGIMSTGEDKSDFFTNFNSPISSRFVDRDMLMRYHWGLGIGHMYSHNPSTNSERFCTSQCSQPSRHVTQDYTDERNGSESLTDTSMQSESDFELEFEPEGSDSGSESKSKSILGDRVDMYGSDLGEMSGCEF